MKKKKATTLSNHCGFTEKEMFALYRVKSSPWFWRKKAEELKYSADVLWPKAIRHLNKVSASVHKKQMPDFEKLPPQVFTTASGLLGFSLECLFKACIIRDNPHFMDNGQQNSQMKTHDLLYLAELGKIPLSQEEKSVCQKLTKTMYVDFRYPVDKNVTSSEGSVAVGRSIIEVGNELYERLHKTVNQIHTADGGAVPFEVNSSRYKKKGLVKKRAKKS
jgi:hypothetical protein